MRREAILGMQVFHLVDGFIEASYLRLADSERRPWALSLIELHGQQQHFGGGRQDGGQMQHVTFADLWGSATSEARS